jgi:hypothetical protein
MQFFYDREFLSQQVDPERCKRSLDGHCWSWRPYHVCPAVLHGLRLLGHEVLYYDRVSDSREAAGVRRDHGALVGHLRGGGDRAERTIGVRPFGY